MYLNNYVDLCRLTWHYKIIMGSYLLKESMLSEARQKKILGLKIAFVSINLSKKPKKVGKK